MEDRTTQSNECLIGIEKEQNGRKAIFEEIMVDNFPKLLKCMNLQIQSPTSSNRIKSNPH